MTARTVSRILALVLLVSFGLRSRFHLNDCTAEQKAVELQSVADFLQSAQNLSDVPHLSCRVDSGGAVHWREGLRVFWKPIVEGVLVAIALVLTLSELFFSLWCIGEFAVQKRKESAASV